MNIQLVQKTYTAEIPVAASSTSQQYNFPVLNNLDGKYTQGISFYPVALMAKSPSGTAVVQQTLLESAFLQLFVGDEIYIYNQPLSDFVTLKSALATDTFGGNPFAIEFENLKVIWAKSFIFVADTSTIPASISSFVFNIKYTDGVVSK